MDRTTRDWLIDEALMNLEHGIDWNWRDQVNAIRQLRIHATSAEEHISALTAKLEAAELKLAACTTAALGNTPESVAERIAPGHPYYSASYGDVCRAVDREMSWRAKLEAAEQERTKWKALFDEASRRAEESRRTARRMDRTNEVLDEPTVRDMLSAFDGQPDSRGRGLGMAICRDWLSLTAKLEQAEQERPTLAVGPSAVMGLFDRWRGGVDGNFSHSDGVRFRQMVDELFAPFAADFKRIV